MAVKNCLFKEYQKTVLNNEDIEDIKIFTMNYDPDIVKHLSNKKKDANIDIYFYGGDETSDNLIKIGKEIEKECNNVNFHYSYLNHIKGILCKEKDGNVFLITGSSNFTKGGLFDKIELNFYQNKKYYDLKDEDLKYSEPSFIQGWCDFVELELDIDLLDEEISGNPMNFYGARDYGKIIKREIRKLSKIEDKLTIGFTTPQVNDKFIFNMFDRYSDSIENLEIITNKINNFDSLKNEFNINVIFPKNKIHAKTFYICGKENYFVGAGTSNITYTGLGFSKRYSAKKEINFCFKGKTEDIEIYKNTVKKDSNMLEMFSLIEKSFFLSKKIKKYLKNTTIDNEYIKMYNIDKILSSINGEDIQNKCNLIKEINDFYKCLGGSFFKYVDL